MATGDQWRRGNDYYIDLYRADMFAGYRIAKCGMSFGWQYELWDCKEGKIIALARTSKELMAQVPPPDAVTK